MNFEELKAAYPRDRKNSAMTGLIPMHFFEAHEAEIRAAARSNIKGPGVLRVIYRGPRYNNVHATRRGDAYGALLYIR